jgi:hypothetical protein
MRDLRLSLPAHGPARTGPARARRTCRAVRGSGARTLARRLEAPATPRRSGHGRSGHGGVPARAARAGGAAATRSTQPRGQRMEGVRPRRGGTECAAWTAAAATAFKGGRETGAGLHGGCSGSPMEMERRSAPERRRLLCLRWRRRLHRSPPESRRRRDHAPRPSTPDTPEGRRESYSEEGVL